jgi:hypothetical protein
MEPASVVLEQRAAAVEPDRIADEPADEVADRARERQHEEGAEAVADLGAEERHMVCRGENAGRDCSGVEHHDLARRRKHRVDHHQQEDGIDAV